MLIFGGCWRHENLVWLPSTCWSAALLPAGAQKWSRSVPTVAPICHPTLKTQEHRLWKCEIHNPVVFLLALEKNSNSFLPQGRWGYCGHHRTSFKSQLVCVKKAWKKTTLEKSRSRVLSLLGKWTTPRRQVTGIDHLFNICQVIIRTRLSLCWGQNECRSQLSPPLPLLREPSPSLPLQGGCQGTFLQVFPNVALRLFPLNPVLQYLTLLYEPPGHWVLHEVVSSKLMRPLKTWLFCNMDNFSAWIPWWISPWLPWASVLLWYRNNHTFQTYRDAVEEKCTKSCQEFWGGSRIGSKVSPEEDSGSHCSYHLKKKK